MPTEDFEQAQALSSQVEQARQRAVLAASDAGAARSDAAGSEQQAREYARRAQAAADATSGAPQNAAEAKAAAASAIAASGAADTAKAAAQAAAAVSSTAAATAKQEAIADATGKYGSVERYLRPDSLTSTDNLNNVLSPRRYRQNQSSVAGNAGLNYPPGATHGFLDVVILDGTAGKYVSQQWTETWGSWIARRRLYSGVWTAWEREGQSAIAPIADRVTALENKSQVNVTVQPGNAVVYGSTRPDPWIYPSGTNIYWNNLHGMTVIPAGYRGEAYVGVLGNATGYSQMLITKAEANNTVDVTCINPSSNRHVTYRLQGTKNATWIDDMQIIEEIWVGGVSGGVPSMDALVSPRSNMEWAFQIDINGNSQFVPHHGVETAIDTGDARGLYKMDGAKIDVASMAVGSRLSGLNGVKMRQSVYGRHPDTGTKNWVRVDQLTTIAPDGLLQSETTWTALHDVKLGNNYAPMTPIVMGEFDTLQVMGGSSYPLDKVAPAMTRYDTITEGRDASSMLITGTGSAKFAALAYLEPRSTLLQNNPMASDPSPHRIEQRNNGWIKVYPSGFTKGSTVPSGTVWEMSAQWRFGETADPARYR